MASSGVTPPSHPCIYDRKSSFMKWLSKIFKGGSGSVSDREFTLGQHAEFLENENIVWRAPPRSLDDCSTSDKEREELDHAMVLPLDEDLKRPQGYKWRTDNDEHFASISASSYPLCEPSYPTNAPSYPPYAPIPYYPSGNRICSGCHTEIGFDKYLGYMGTFFHPECFRCRFCGHPITEHEFSLSGRDPYHKTCFKVLTHPNCEVCHQFIPTNAAGMIEYRCHPFWAQKYCPSHEHDNTPRCCSCERLESWNTRYVLLGDGRSLCRECKESAIMDNGNFRRLYDAIRDFYEGLKMKLHRQIPVLLVERHALNDAFLGEKHGSHHMSETRGLCLSKEQTVTSMLRRPRFGLVGIRTHPQKLTRKYEVTAILVLYGLPRLLTGAILAHELMHGWLRLKGYCNLNPEVEEGICQVLSYMWLESEMTPGFANVPLTSMGSSSSSSSLSSSKKGRKSPVQKKLGEFFLHQIANDASPAYGGGFRAANAVVRKYGLHHTLNHMRSTGNFPS